MAIADQLKALIKSHMDGDDSHFYAVAMQVAAHEAKRGHGKLAKELRELIDEAKAKQPGTGKPIPIAQPRGEISSLLAVSYPKIRLADMVLDTSTSERLVKVIKEQRQISKIRSLGLSPRRKLLFAGAPGTGKTMSASVLAGELGLPLFMVRLESLITKYMGETAAKLRLIFDAIAQSRGIYLFDEFDSIGSQRGQVNDVGEIRRILNSFLQMIEQDDSDSIIIAATNHPDILDYALFRRFDDVIEYDLPDKHTIITLFKTKLSVFAPTGLSWKKLAEKAVGLSHADITKIAEDAIKDALIFETEKITSADLTKLIEERKRLRKF